MDELQKLIDEYLLAGKNDEEIAELIMQHEDAKRLNAKEIAGLILERQGAKEVAEEMKKVKDENAKKEADKENKKEADEAIKKQIDEHLKSLQIDPFRKYADQKELKRFNHQTKLFETIKTPSVVYGGMNNMMRAFLDKDWASAKSISNDISEDNFQKKEALYGIKITRSDSDAAGGYAIPTEVDETIFQLLYAASVMLQKVNTENIIVEDKVFPLMYGISVAYVANQATALTETSPTFTNPSINMKRVGGWSSISNTIIRQKGADLVQAFVAALAAGYATFFDLHIPCGNVTDSGDLVDGIFFDSNASAQTAIALTALIDETLLNMINALGSAVMMNNVYFAGNRKVLGKIGQLENTAGFRLFPDFLRSRNVSPYGVPFIENAQIPSTLDIAGDKRVGGTSDGLICGDMSNVVVGISPETRIDESQHFQFTTDAMVIRAIKSFGQKIISSSATAGKTVVLQELTN